jgi:outer membrane immunogenic protein
MKSFSLAATALLGASALACLAGPALAQPAPDTHNWEGPYVGLNAGWNSANTSVAPGTATTQQLTGVNAGAGPVTVPPATFNTAQQDYSTQSWAAGGQVGYNHQIGHWVLGAEGDMDALGGRSRQFSNYALPATSLTSANAVSISRSTNPDWTASVRGRVGYATGRLLIYGTGGLGLADARQNVTYGYAPTVTPGVAAANPGTSFGTSNGDTNDRVLVGYTAGGGAEFALNRAVSIGAEYRHSDYGDNTYALGSSAPGATRENTRIGFSDDQVLAKVNFRFGGGFF